MTKREITYRPWSKRVREACFAAQDRGEMPILDLEFTAKCTQASCVYCDSRPRVGRAQAQELGIDETERVLTDAAKVGLRWVYACGLGEPLEDPRFYQFVERLSGLGARLSVFTNALLINDEKAAWLREKGVCLIVKLDTFDGGTFDKILGRPGASERVYRALDSLLNAGYGQKAEDGQTDLAFSIVPTRLALSQIEDVVVFAREHNIFPSVGELERAGRAARGTKYDELALTQDELRSLRNRLEQLLWKGYVRPVCPAIVAGVHVDNIGDCVVDKATGLNCKWFLLREPTLVKLGNVRKDSIVELYHRVLVYRRKCFKENTEAIEQCAQTVYTFGGCGGSPCRIIRFAREHLVASDVR